MPKLDALAREFHYYYLFLKRFSIFLIFRHQTKSKMANPFFQFKQFVVWHDKCGMKVGTDGVYLFLKRFSIFLIFRHQTKSKMANPFFQFKQFVVWHDKCGMKVGTDGVLLGAWASVRPAGSLLDIGTGTGLVALMLAQRSPSDVSITALEIDPDAAAQARENVERSPWKERIAVKEADFRTFRDGQFDVIDPDAAAQARENVERSPWKERIAVKEADFRTFRDGQFDVIVSNPPYFMDSLSCPDQQRTRARHNDSLTYEELVEGVSRLLSPAGVFSVVIPMDVADRVTELAALKGLYPVRRLLVRTKPDAAPKRTLIAFSFTPGECEVEELLTEVARHQYSPEYIALTRDFYLKM